METVASIDSKLDALKAEVAAVAAKISTAPAPVATQADLDGIGGKIDAVASDVAALPH